MFLNLLIFFCALILSLLIFFVGLVLSKKSIENSELMSPFECGFMTSDRGFMPFSLRFFLLANIFLIFDVELILLFPFLAKFTQFYSNLIIFFLLFLLFLSLGLFHEWNQKMLEWIK